MRVFSIGRRIGAMGAIATIVQGCQTIGADYSSIREALLTSVSIAREARPAEPVILEPASLDPAAKDAPPVRRRPEREAPRSPVSSRGGAFLERVEAVTAGCILPTTPTYLCFEGEFAVLVAGGAASIGEHSPQPIPSRGPSTFLYVDRTHGVAFYGDEAEGAPVALAGDRVFSPVLERYLDDVLHRLLRQSPVSPPEMKAFLTRSTHYGATATPDGDIFVSLGALSEIQNEDQLAALLAQQAAHLLLAHFDRRDFVDGWRLRAGSLSSAALMAPDNRGAAPLSPGSLSEAELSAAIAVEAALAKEPAQLGASWSARIQDEAAILAVDLLVRAGYAPSAILDSLAYWQVGAREAGELISLEHDDVELRAHSMAEQNGGGAVFDQMLNALSEVAVPELNELFLPAAAVRDDRFADLDAYIRRQHDAALGRAPTLGSLQKAKAAADFERMYLDYQQAEAAANLLRQGRPQAAAELLTDILRGPIGGDPYPQGLFARVFAGMGDWRQALASFKDLRAGAVASPDGYILKARLETRLGSPKQALLTLEAAIGFYGPSLFLAPQVAALVAADDANGAQVLAAECRKPGALTPAAGCDFALDALTGPQFDETAQEAAPKPDHTESSSQQPPPDGWDLGEVVQAGARRFKSLF